MRCQAIKRDGHQCNYHSRPTLMYCGVHRRYTPPREELPGPSTERGRPTNRVPRFFNDEINLIIQVMGVSENRAIDIFIESAEIERNLRLNNQTDCLINSFKSLDVSQDNCSICISKPESLVKTPCCKKEFCEECLKKWAKLKKNCPACRANLS